MKYTIIIPTYTGHLRQAELFLESFKKFCLDKESFEIKLIISKNEHDSFSPLIEKYGHTFNIAIVHLADILKLEEDVEVDESKLLATVGKFNFQSLKKIYGVKHFSAHTSLVLDSEALMIRKASLKKVFEEYQNDKFIIHASSFQEKIQNDVAHVSFEILGKPFQDIWFFEYYYWFFEKKYVDEMFAYIFQTTGKTLYENLLYKKPIFEHNLYALYLYLFHADEYLFIDANTLLGRYLDKTELAEYKRVLKGTASFSYLCWGLTQKNIAAFSKLFQDMHMAFFRYDDRYGDADVQAAFVQQNKGICLLTSRMVSTPFSVGEFNIPANFDKKNNQEIVYRTTMKNITHYVKKVVPNYVKNMVPKKIRRSLRFAQKFCAQEYETMTDLLYAAIVKSKMDSHQMILRYKPRLGKGETFIDEGLAYDVGAYTGTSLERIRSLGYKNVICFEPSFKSFVKLYKKNRKDPYVSFVNKAVSDVSETTIEFYENPLFPTLNTTSKSWITDTRHSELVPSPSLERTSVRTITLDEAINIIGAIPGYIKIDVEGHELAVLKGLHHKPKMLSFEWISEKNSRNIEVLSHCAELGFKDFYLCYEERLPTFVTGMKLHFDGALAEWRHIQSSDTNNRMWGNIWCK